MAEFWGNRDMWLKTWKGNTTAFKIDHVKVWSITETTYNYNKQKNTDDTITFHTFETFGYFCTPTQKLVVLESVVNSWSKNCLPSFATTKMPIIYSLVAMNKTILAEQAESKIKGNFQGVSKQIIEKIASKNTKVTYEYDAYVI